MIPRQAPRRPATLLNAVRILILCLGIELLGYVFSGNYTLGGIVGVVAGGVLVFWLLRQLHAGANWARYTVVACIVVGTIASVSTFLPNYRRHPGETVIDLISTLLSLIAGALLFTRTTSAWFKPA